MNRIRVHLSIDAGDGEKETKKGKNSNVIYTYIHMYTCQRVSESKSCIYAIVNTSRSSWIQSNFAYSMLSYRGYKVDVRTCYRRDCVLIKTRLDAGMN